MKRSLAAALALLVGGCASGPPFVDQMQSTAMGKAERRGQFELSCQAATGQVINREELAPMAFGGPTRAQYTIGVTGCGKKMTVVVLCSQNNNQCVERVPSG